MFDFNQVVAIWGALGGIVPACAALLAWALYRPATAAREDATQLCERLAHHMELHLVEEERLNRIHDPWPMPVRLVPTELPLMDQWNVIHRAPTTRTPIELTGTVGDVQEIFERIPSGRMVLLGPGGAGKTTTALRLAAALAQSWQSGQPVPVVVPLAQWDATAVSLQDWLVRWLSENIPLLVNRQSSTRELVNEGRLLLVLDGLDELPQGARPKAIIAINRSLVPKQRLVLTSRPAEYADAVAAGEVLRAAAVLELQELNDAAIWEFLQTVASPTAAARWAELRESVSPADPLVKTLAVPLFVAMARDLYGTGDADPRLLLDRQRYPDRASVEAALLTSFVEHALTRRLTAATLRRRDWRIAAARRTLRFLARSTVHSGSSTFASWQLHNVAPRLAAAAPFAGAMGVLASAGIGLFLMIYRPTAMAEGSGWAMGLAFGVCVTAVAVVVGALTIPFRPRAVPSLIPRPASVAPSLDRQRPWEDAGWVIGAWLLLSALQPLAQPPWEALGAFAIVTLGLPWLLIPAWRHRAQIDAIDRYHRAIVAFATFCLGMTGYLCLAVFGGLDGGVAVGLTFFLVVLICGFLNKDRDSREDAQHADTWDLPSPWLIMLTALAVFLVALLPGTVAELLKSPFDGATILLGRSDWVSGMLIALLAGVALYRLGAAFATIRTADRRPYRIAPRLRDLPVLLVGPVGIGAAIGTTTGFASGFILDVFSGLGDFVSSIVATSGPRSSATQTLAAAVQLQSHPLADAFADPPEVDSAASLAMLGAAVGLIIALSQWARTPVDTAESVNHRAVLRSDRTVFLLAMLLPLAVSIPLLAAASDVTSGSLVETGADCWQGVGDWLSIVWPVAQPLAQDAADNAVLSAALGLVLIASIPVGFIGVPIIVYSTRDLAWQQYRGAHLWLALTRRVPLRFARFLQTAQEAGILRQTGAAYQFRHPRLLQYLAAQTDE
jgi:hypothetical protein